jgi:hypothetical protein
VSGRFRISPEIVHETVDGEVIAIDLGSGSYYSLAGSGPAIWELLGRGVSEEELCGALVARFGADAGAVGADVEAFVGQLRDSGLLLDAGEGGGVPGVPVSLPDDGGDAYEAPRLERYTDMKDYFLLDPIHEVNPEAGWPQPAAD